ncbi:collagen alpha-1(II) chain-like [Nycticebus coucang]|uniref:collagen alpha-1(II) chain-like n=1 Tax=Nycticebus coucang TaxID=9470 RepID=UPI00234D2169|nr:collagen alpha-1(II) chain-like [Nycticebus coucang]
MVTTLGPPGEFQIPPPPAAPLLCGPGPHSEGSRPAAECLGCGSFLPPSLPPLLTSGRDPRAPDVRPSAAGWSGQRAGCGRRRRAAESPPPSGWEGKEGGRRGPLGERRLRPRGDPGRPSCWGRGHQLNPGAGQTGGLSWRAGRTQTEAPPPWGEEGRVQGPVGARLSRLRFPERQRRIRRRGRSGPRGPRLSTWSVLTKSSLLLPAPFLVLALPPMKPASLCVRRPQFHLLYNRRARKAISRLQALHL